MYQGKATEIEPELALLAAVVAAAHQSAPWFPGLHPERVEAHVTQRWVRPRCVLHQVTLHDRTGGSPQGRVVVKVRRDVVPDPLTGSAPQRPTLAAADPLTSVEMARHEFEGLSLIATAMRDRANRTLVVRPLALLPDQAAVVMDHVDLPPLRQLLMGSSRVTPSPRPVDLEGAFDSAGAWLRAYHGVVPRAPLPTRQQSRDELAPLVERYVRFLEGRTGDREFFAWLGQSATRLIERALPERLPLALGHGDFVARNLFVAPGGRVAVIDPMPRWFVPPYEDLARFVVGMRLLGLQVATSGLALGLQQLDRYETRFLTGYFGGEVPVGPMIAYQLIVLLDKWSATVNRAPVRWPLAAVDAPRRLLAHRYFRTQARRLLSGAAERALERPR